MLKYLKRRLLMLIPLLLVVSVLIFSMIHLMPGDPAMIIAGEGAKEEDIQAIRHKYGFDRPLYEQYFKWLGKIIRGDFGIQYALDVRFPQRLDFVCKHNKACYYCDTYRKRSRSDDGIISATRRYSFIDNVTMVIAMIGVSITPFYLGLMAILLFSVNLGWLPMMGVETWKGWILPATTLAFRPAAMIAV